jgi:hypothetical protein
VTARKHKTDTSPGWIRRKFAAYDKKLQELSAARRLEAATIGKGGLTIKDGGTVTGKYLSGRTAFLLGAVADNTFGVSVLKDEPESDLKRNLLDVYRIGPVLPYVPDGANVVQSLGGDFFLARGSEGASLTAGPPGDSEVAGITVVADGGGINISSTSGDVWLDGGTDGVKVNHATTSASANCFIDPSDGRLWRSTSSERYKQDIEDLDVDIEAVLAIRPRTWRDRSEVEANPDTTRRYVGAIAEELDELGGGLEQFVVYDDQGRPDAIAYDRVTVALIATVRDLADRVKELEGDT